MAVKDNKNNYEECPNCGKKVNVEKSSFCSSCGIEIFCPVIDRKWSYKTIIIIVIALMILYAMFIWISPSLYYSLDKV